MGGSPPRGQTWGNSFESGVPLRAVVKEKWICLEVIVKIDDLGDSNGEQAYWLDGKLSRNRDGKITSYLGKGFPAVGTWTYDGFKPYVTEQGIAWDYREGKGVRTEGGKPFPGFAWRTTPESEHQRHLALPLHVATRDGYEQGLVGPFGGRQEVHRSPDAGGPIGQIKTRSNIEGDDLGLRQAILTPGKCAVGTVSLS